MLNSGEKFRALRDKKNNILTLVLSEKKILNKTKTPPPPPPLQVKWSVPKFFIGNRFKKSICLFLNSFVRLLLFCLYMLVIPIKYIYTKP